jgi:hypothetical protein
MPDTLESMRVFVEVSEQGSFTSVATARGIANPVIASAEPCKSSPDA